MPDIEVRQESISLEASLVPGGDPLVLSLTAGHNHLVRIECLSGFANPILQVQVTMSDPEGFKVVPVLPDAVR